MCTKNDIERRWGEVTTETRDDFLACEEALLFVTPLQQNPCFLRLIDVGV